MSQLLFFITAIALIVSFISEFKKRGEDGLALTIWKYLSYYTTLSNILVLYWFAALAYGSSFSLFQLAQNANVSAAITFYITTVGIANYLIFGWQKLSLLNRIADLLVHAVTPVITFVYWFVFAEKKALQFALLSYWLVFPIGYAVYTAIHGQWSRFYPYEFTNVQSLGFKKVLFNALGLSLCLLVGGALFIFLGKVIG